MSSSVSPADVSNTLSAATSSITNPNVLTGSRVLVFTTTIPNTATVITASVNPVLSVDTPAQRAKINNIMNVIVTVTLIIYLGLTILLLGMWLRGRYQERLEKHRYGTLAQTSADEIVKAPPPEVTLTPHTPVMSPSNHIVDSEALIGTPSINRGAGPSRQEDSKLQAVPLRGANGRGQRDSRFSEDTGYADQSS